MQNLVTHIQDPKALVARIREHRDDDQNRFLSLISPLEFSKRFGQVRHGKFDFDGTISKGHVWGDVENSEMVGPAMRGLEREMRKVMIDGEGEDGQLEIHGVNAKDHAWSLMAESEEEKYLNALLSEAGWIDQSITTWAVEGVTLEGLEEIAAKTEVREGVRELFQLLEKRFIISFGVIEFIEAFLKHHNLRAVVAATKLLTKVEGRTLGSRPKVVSRVVGSHPLVKVTPKNKGMMANNLAKLHGADPAQTLTVGDSITDVDLMDPNGAMNVMIVPRKKQLHFRDGHIEQMVRHHVHAVLMSDSFGPFVQAMHIAR